MPTLFVTEIFRSLQGEGAKLGTPSIFLRLGFCNLQCTWCDTPYTWQEGKIEAKEMKLEKVMEKIQNLRQGNSINNLVITGGEPLLQQKSLVHLLANKQLDDMSIEFETNGSQRLLPAIESFKGRVSFNISPKLKDSGNEPYKVYFYPNSVLKFVYVGKKSERLIHHFLGDNEKEVERLPVFIMPQGTSVSEMAKNYQHMINYCLKNGFRFSPRLHVYLFGNKRGT